MAGTREPGYRPDAWEAGIAEGGAQPTWDTRLFAAPCAAPALRARCRGPALQRWSARGVRLEVPLFPSRLRRVLPAAASLFFVCHGPVSAQTIVVTGAREPLSAERLVGDVVVIDEEALRDSTADSLADLLRRNAGVQLSRNGGPGQSSGALIRGASSGQTVVLVDGVRVGSATLGYAALEALDLSQVERIEVLRGPGSSLYGADAVGGVVQIFTRRGEPGTSRVDAHVAAGSRSSRDLSAGWRGGAERWDAALTLSQQASDGVSTLRAGDAFGNHNPDRDGFTLGSGQARLGWRPAAGQRFGLTLLRSRNHSQYDASEFLPPTFAQDNTADFRTRLTTDVQSLDWRGSFGATLVASARASRSEDESTSGGRSLDRFRTVRDQFGAQLAWQAGPWGRVVGALEHQRERAASSSYLAEVERESDAVVLALDGSAGAWSWQADARHDEASDFGGVDTARLGGNWSPAPRWRLRALAGSTFRAPSFNDLVFPGYGVPTLRPERGRSIEFGLGWAGAGGDASLTWFRNRVRELIGYESDRSLCPPAPDYDFGCARNISRATLEGVTLSGARQLGAWSLNAQLDFLQARDRDTGQRLARRAAHQGTLAASWRSGPWSAGASVLRVGERPDGGARLAAETTLDLQAGWQLAPGWTLRGRLLNATDRRLEPARDYQGLGRQAWLALYYEAGL